MKVISATLLALLIAAASFAHSGGRDIHGTIVSFDRQAIVVKRVDGKKERVPLTAATEYRVGKSAGEWADMRDRSRVVVHIGHDGNAVEVQLPANQ